MLVNFIFGNFYLYANKVRFYNFEINFLCYILLVIIYENVCDKGIIKKKKNSRNYIFKINNVIIT